jgi:hypothetical protein
MKDLPIPKLVPLLKVLNLIGVVGGSHRAHSGKLTHASYGLLRYQRLRLILLVTMMTQTNLIVLNAA